MSRTFFQPPFLPIQPAACIPNPIPHNLGRMMIPGSFRDTCDTSSDSSTSSSVDTKAISRQSAEFTDGNTAAHVHHGYAAYTHSQQTASKFSGDYTAGNNKRLIVQHSYHDHSSEYEPIVDGPALDEYAKMREQDTTTTHAFPLLLHRLLDSASMKGYEDIVSWQQHGRSFHVHNVKRFVADVMPKFFRQTRYSSFQRQLSLYGFLRLSRKDSPDYKGYYHEFFLRGMPHLCRHIQRMRVKGYGIRSVSSPETEPDFYAMNIPANMVDLSETERLKASLTTSLKQKPNAWENPPQETVQIVATPQCLGGDASATVGSQVLFELDNEIHDNHSDRPTLQTQHLDPGANFDCSTLLDSSDDDMGLELLLDADLRAVDVIREIEDCQEDMELIDFLAETLDEDV